MSDYDVTFAKEAHTVTVREAGGGLQLTVEGHTHEVALIPWVPPTHFILLVDGSSTPVVVMRAGEELRVTIGCDQHRVRIARSVPIPRRGAGGGSRSSEVRVEAPMPGLIVAVQAQSGATIEQGAPVVIMEAMKMQMEIRAPSAGRIRSVRVQAGQEVSKGQVLVELAAETTA